LNALKANINTLNNIKKKAIYKRDFSFFNYNVAIATDSRKTIHDFEKMYSKFLKHDQSRNGLDCYIITGSTHNKSSYVILTDKIYPIADSDSIVFFAEALIFKALFNRVADCFILHAGVISRDGKGFIIMGPSSFGKTTLVLELISRGYKFLSDEYCSIRLNDHFIEPYPRSLGIKHDNPFYCAVDLKKKIHHARENKAMVECENIYPDCTGAPCKASCLIVLKNSLQNSSLKEEEKVFEVTLLHDDRKAADTLCSNESIKLLYKSIKANFVLYRFSFVPNSSATTTIQDFCVGHEDNILSQVVFSNDRPDFNSKPTIKVMSKFDASLEVFKNLVNRSTESRLYKKFKKQNSLILYKIGEIIKSLDCYEMQPGILKETANIIDSL